MNKSPLQLEYKVLEEFYNGGVIVMDYEETEILQQFDSIFWTDTLKNLKNINFNEMKFLIRFFEYFEEELYRPSEESNKLRKEQVEIVDKLDETFTKEQQILFDKYWEVSNQIIFEEQQQLFLFGYIVAKEMEKEAQLHKEKNK